MDKKLIAAITFGLLAVSVANLLLSVGVLSLLLANGQGTSTQLADTSNVPGTWVTARNSVSLAGMDNSTAANVTNVTTAMNATGTPMPSTDQQFPAGMPSSGQWTPPSGQRMPSGQGMPSGAGQVPSGAQPAASGNSQLPSGTGQSQTGSGAVSADTWSSLTNAGYIPVDMSSLTGSQSRATPTPKPSSSVFANFSSLWNQ